MFKYLCKLCKERLHSSEVKFKEKTKFMFKVRSTNFDIGDEVYLMRDNKIVKDTIIGIKIGHFDKDVTSRPKEEYALKSFYCTFDISELFISKEEILKTISDSSDD